MVTFTDARLKIDRANKHIAETDRRIELITGRDGQASRVEIHTKAGVKSVHYHLKRLGDLPELACIIGDAIHNLKTALDYAWCRTISILAPGIKGRSKFPIYPSVHLLKSALAESGISTANPDFVDFILTEIKPYDGGNFYLRPLHKFDIRDKHELLIPSTNYGNVSGLKIKDQCGATDAGTWGQELAEEFHIDLPLDVEIEDKGYVSLGIVFKEGPLKDMEVSSVLKVFSGTVLGIVELLEKRVFGDIGGPPGSLSE
jgi:hypothetical protein